MKTKIIAVLLMIVVIIAITYIFMPHGTAVTKPVTQPKANIQTDQQIDSAINQEMDSTLANVSQADVEQALLS